MKVFDEFGNPWRVAGGDPAAKLIARLTRARIQLVVLPMKTLATGVLAEPANEPDDPIRRLRLALCLDELKGA